MFFYFKSVSKVECIYTDSEVLLYNGLLVHNIVKKKSWVVFAVHTHFKKILINTPSQFKNGFNLVKDFNLTKEKSEPSMRKILSSKPEVKAL